MEIRSSPRSPKTQVAMAGELGYMLVSARPSTAVSQVFQSLLSNMRALEGAVQVYNLVKRLTNAPVEAWYRSGPSHCGQGNG